MSLIDDISRDMNIAAKAGEKLKLSTLRLFLSAVKYKEKDNRKPLEDEEIQQIATTLIRQRLDSIEQFTKGNRHDLVEHEKQEIEYLKAYIPAQLTVEEVRDIIKKTAAEIQAVGLKDMGKLMKAVMPHVKGKADGKLVNDIVKEVLS